MVLSCGQQKGTGVTHSMNRYFFCTAETISQYYSVIFKRNFMLSESLMVLHVHTHTEDCVIMFNNGHQKLTDLLSFVFVFKISHKLTIADMPHMYVLLLYVTVNTTDNWVFYTWQ